MPLSTFVGLWSQYHPPADGEAEAEDDDLEDGDGLPGLPRSRRVKQHFDAALARLAYERRAAELINKAEVEAVLAAALRQVHERINAITPRIVASLGAALGPLTAKQEEQVRQVLEPEVAEALESVAAIQFTAAEPGAATATESAGTTAT